MAPVPVLTGYEGELVLVRIAAEPHHLEDLLDCLARLSFPVNPQLYHGLPPAVEFPAYEGRLDEVRSALRACGFDPSAVRVTPALERPAA